MADRYANPHLEVYVRADSVIPEGANPPQPSSLQELRVKFNLGCYTVAKLEKLLGKISETVEEWVEKNPPQG